MTTTVFEMQRPKELKDWQSSVPPETVERAKKALAAHKKNFYSTANYIGVGATDDLVSPFLGSACHASMSSVPEPCRDVLATENGRFRRIRREDWNVSVEEARPFLEWFLYESPYGFIILNRDDLSSCEKYGFVLAGDAPTTYVQCACIISRHFYEVKRAAFIEFNKLVERGIDGFIAYQICFNSTISTLEQTGKLENTLFGSGPGHRVSTAVAPEQMLNYYRGDLQNPLGKTYKEAPSIYGSTKLFLDRNENNPYDLSWTLPEYRKNSVTFHKYMLETEGKLVKSDIYRPPNPFVKQQTERTEMKFTCQQAVTVVADYIQNYISENL